MRTAPLRRRLTLERSWQIVDRQLFGLLPLRLRAYWLDAVISSQLRREPGSAPFSVPLSRALSALGEEALSIMLPVSRLGVRLHDWVSCQGRIVHTSDHFLFRGDWSSLLFASTKTRTMHEARSLHAVGLDFRRATAYLEDRKQIEKGRFFRRNKVLINRVELLDAYYTRFVDLFESVMRFGVLSLADARRQVPGLHGRSQVRGWRVSRGERDIGVAIGAAGELVVLPGAKHRLAIASVLEVPMVPVQVRMVHGDWLLGLPADRPWPDRLLAGVEMLAANYRGAVA